jgi:tetratricopeptide (TPR) repeat protein
MVNRLRLLGDAYRRLGDFASARKYYEEALESSRRYYLFEHQLRIRNGLANLLLQMGNWAEAIEQYKPALDLAMQLEGKATAVDVIANIGFAYAKLAQFDDAIEYLELALDFAKGPEAESSAQVRRTIPSIHITLGHAHYEKKEYDEALRHLNIALECDQKTPLESLMRYNLYGTLAEVQLARGHAEKAQGYLSILETLAGQLPEAQSHFKGLKEQIDVKLGTKVPSL